MKKIALGSLALTALAGTSFAAFSLTDDITLRLTGDVGVVYDDNIQLGDGTVNPKVDDVIFNFKPGLTLEFGKKGLAVFNFSENFTRYADTANINTNLASLSFRSTLDTGKTTGSLNAGFAQLNANTPTATGGVSGVPGLLRRDNTTAGGNVKFTLSEKSNFGVGVTYDKTDYKLTTLADSQITTVPITYYQEITPNLYITPSIRYRKTQLSAPATSDFTDYYYSVGLDGQFDPKLSGNVSVGLNKRQAQVGKNESSVGLDSNLNWKYTEKTTFGFNVKNDFGASSVGASQKTLSLGANASTELAVKVTGSANVNYSSTRYAAARVDKNWRFGVSVNWALYDYFSLSAGYDYTDNSSSIGGANSYSDNKFSITGTVRY